MAAAKILMLYNEPTLPKNHAIAASEHTVVEIAEELKRILEKGRYRVAMLGLKNSPSPLWRQLEEDRPNLIFNLYEGDPRNPDTESWVTGLLEWTRIPFTGSPLTALTVARAKHLCKRVLKGAGLPTADFFVIESLPIPECPLAWPVILKPAHQDASVGMSQTSVATDHDGFERQAEFLLKTFGPPVLVERYIPGREFNVCLTELPALEYLPPAEIHFPESQPGQWPILTYDGKWRPGTPDYGTTPTDYPAKISKALARKMGALAMTTYRLLGMRDYGRIDFRVPPTGKPYILEVNPNPEISAEAGFGGCLGSVGITHEDFILRLAENALRRQPPPILNFDALNPTTETVVK